MANLPDFSSQGTLVTSSPSAKPPDFSSQGIPVDQSAPTVAPHGPIFTPRSYRGPIQPTGFEAGAYLGGMSDWDRASEALARGAGDVVHAFGAQEWMPGASLTAKDLAAEKAFRQEYQNQPGFGAGTTAGQILGTIPTASVGGEVPGALGAAAKLLGTAGAGAETGAPGAKGAAIGAALGAGTAGLGAGAGRLVKKFVQPEAQRLMDAGVKLTPGQMKGGAASSMEEKLSGTMPITGHLIKKARDQSIHDWNTATLNRALAPIGEKITGSEKSGYEAVAEAGD